jgi:hypothetical protein
MHQALESDFYAYHKKRYFKLCVAKCFASVYVGAEDRG